MMFHVRIPKSKKRKVPKAKKEQHDAWMKSISSMSTNFSYGKPKATSLRVTPLVTTAYRRETEVIKSLGNGIGVATKAVPKQYTGNLVKGIATMHKSNAVPVFTDEHAIEISKMRRG